MSESAKVSVIVPAHNEEALIRRTLGTLLRSAEAGEFEVLVICNGCSDRTAQLAGEGFPDVEVVELEEASKTAALNAGLRRACGDVVLLLDADIELQTAAARALADAARAPGVEAAIGHMVVDTTGASSLVRAFYRVWMEHPYISNGKFAAAIALSRAGVERVGTMPGVTADDTYLRRLFPAERVAIVESVRFQVQAPRTAEALVRVRSRSYRGTRELASRLTAPDQHQSESQSHVRRLLSKPALWPHVPIYLGVTLAARSRSYRNAGVRWERDLTTRPSPPEHGA